MSKKKKTIEEILKESIILEEEQPYEVPENWVWIRFDSLIKTNSNLATAIKQTNYEEEGEIPVVDQGMELISGFTNNQEHQYTGELPVIVFGDHTRRIKWIDFNFAQGADGTKLLKPLEHFYPKYFYYLLKTINLPNKGYSRHFKYLRGSVLPVSPLEEQKRIVEKIEKFLGKVDEAKMLIQESKKSFEIRRASILDKAFRGELTSEWRNNNNSLSLVDEWVRGMKIVKEEKRKDKFKDQLNSSVLDELYELPKEWRWVRLNDLIDQSTYGTSSKTNDNKSGKPVLRMGNIIDGCFDLNNLKYLDNENEDVLKYDLETNDLLFNRTNSYELVGKTSLITTEMSGKYSFASYLIRIRLLDKDILASYIVHYINSHVGRGILLSMVSQQVGQANINSQKLASLPIPLPPKEEVIKITRVLDKYRSLEREQKKMMNIEEQIEILKESILSKAFRGKLGTTIADEDNIIKLLEKTYS